MATSITKNLINKLLKRCKYILHSSGYNDFSGGVLFVVTIKDLTIRMSFVVLLFLFLHGKMQTQNR